MWELLFLLTLYYSFISVSLFCYHLLTTCGDKPLNIRPQIFKLNDDCMQEIFDLLSIQDIHSVAETCTRMQRVAGDYFQTYLPALGMYYMGGDVKRFKNFAQSLGIDKTVNEEGYRSIGLCGKSFKKMRFNLESQLNPNKIEYIKPILSTIETAIFWSVNLDLKWYSSVEYEFYQSFLQFCPNLKHLSISMKFPRETIGANNEWLRRSYPKLEHLELIRNFGLRFPEFFQRNPSLQTLSLDQSTFLENIDAMLQSKMKLQVLFLHIRKVYYVRKVCRQLNKLHGKGFYRRLHLYLYLLNDHHRNVASNVQGLEILYIDWSCDLSRLNLNSLTNLKEIGFDSIGNSDTFANDLRTTAESLVKLERLHFNRVKSEIIESLIEYWPKLKAIKIEHFEGKNLLSLSSLNKKREQLVGATKIIIYLRDDAYMATKWSNRTMHFKMIAAKRTESCDWWQSYSEFHSSYTFKLNEYPLILKRK